MIGRIQGENKFVKSLNKLANEHGVDWKTIKRAINYTGPTTRKPRCVLPNIRRRREIVRRCAKKRCSKNGREYPVFASSEAIRKFLSNKRISASKSTVQRDLRAGGFTCRVRRRVPTREPAVLEKRRRFCAKWVRKTKQMKTVVFSDEHTVSINDHGSRTMWVDEDRFAPSACTRAALFFCEHFFL